MKSHRKNYSRRDFLRTGAAASIGLATGSIWMPKTIRANANETSRVVVVTDELAFDGQNIQPDVVRVMIDEGMKALTDASNPADAWLTIFLQKALRP